MQNRAQIPLRDSRLVLGLLLLIDALGFVSLGYEAEGLVVGLSASTLAIGQLIIDASLAWGLLHARAWALELARYRCVLGVGLLFFLWMSFLLMQDLGAGLRAHPEFLAAGVRDGLIGLLLIGNAFLLRKRKHPIGPGLGAGEPDPEA